MAETIDVKSLRVVDLRKELEKRNLSKTGKKDELVARLEEALLQENTEESNNNTIEEEEEKVIEEEEENKQEEKEEEKEEEKIKEKGINNKQDNIDNNKEKDTQQIPLIEKEPVSVEEKGKKSDNNVNIDKNEKEIAESQPQKETDKIEETVKETPENDTSTTTEDKPKSPTPSNEETETIDKVDKMDEDQINKRKRDDGLDEDNKEKRTKLEADSETSKAESTKDDKETTTTSTGNENEEQTAICIKNLRRPLISRDVRVLVGNHGEIQRFFMDNVKTHCYVIYNNVKEADDALKNIHGIKFPPETGENVSVLKLYPSQVEQLIKREQELESQGITRTPWEKFLNNLIENKDIDDGLNNDNDSSHSARRRMAPLEQIAKQLNQRTTISIIGQGKERKPKSILDRLSSTQQAPPPKAPVGKSLDELFLKTQATPPLYYLPVEKSVATERLASLSRK